MVVLDTNIIIDHLRLQEKDKDSRLISLVRKNPQQTLAISIISIQELYEGQSTKNSDKEQSLLATISSLKILPYTYEIAERAGKLARDLGRPIELADVAIAATAIANGASLLTLNNKDFSDIKGLTLD